MAIFDAEMDLLSGMQNPELADPARTHAGKALVMEKAAHDIC